MKALIHVQETCIWLGSLASLVMAISFLEPAEIKSAATPQPSPNTLLSPAEDNPAKGSQPWWDSPRS